ncbi:hypothetical protein [Prochlorothrix hollandica]|uniref:Transcriptional regulator n=1 Tax=Prochlorothrix hollandica PCC 9006 = CALU 1027 TaxID=317619 RepID=A0A0M2Q3Y4_PROHO|nr:hypothetical protein [Prochlorothrix hollandica]KKJ01302.1 transcriptional regulator [Prochlorothrix hollandica PCC 9006 = CALU 1027]
MDLAQQQCLEARGWRIGTVAEFLELTPAESLLVEMKLALGQHLRERQQAIMSHGEPDDLTRLAKAADWDESVSLEFLIHTLLAVGYTPQDIGQVIAQVG